MEENKYFTPSIEDIRVGYECEILSIHGKAWLKTTIAEWCPGFQLEALRVPYLTKEQIEAEGWEYDRNYEAIEDSKWPEEMGFLKELPDNLTQFLLYYNPNNQQLRVEKIYDCGGEGWIFQGNCKDINTLRYICKLLNIN